jgi:hypothetical protein
MTSPKTLLTPNASPKCASASRNSRRPLFKA